MHDNFATTPSKYKGTETEAPSSAVKLPRCNGFRENESNARQKPISVQGFRTDWQNMKACGEEAPC